MISQTKKLQQFDLPIEVKINVRFAQNLTFTFSPASGTFERKFKGLCLDYLSGIEVDDQAKKQIRKAIRYGQTRFLQIQLPKLDLSNLQSLSLTCYLSTIEWIAFLNAPFLTTLVMNQNDVSCLKPLGKYNIKLTYIELLSREYHINELKILEPSRLGGQLNALKVQMRDLGNEGVEKHITFLLKIETGNLKKISMGQKCNFANQKLRNYIKQKLNNNFLFQLMMLNQLKSRLKNRLNN